MKIGDIVISKDSGCKYQIINQVCNYLGNTYYECICIEESGESPFKWIKLGDHRCIKHNRLELIDCNNIYEAGF